VNGLSLCAGVGGLDLGVELAFNNYRAAVAVENNEEAARRFHARFPEALLFRDLLQFDGRPWRGCFQAVVAGFPCQPHSVAGARKGTADERWIWPDIARIIGEVDPDSVFLENVSGLLRDARGGDADQRALGPGGSDLDDDAAGSMGGMGEVLRDLACLGFVSAWGRLRASDVGASHGRPRVFILAVKPGSGVLLEHSANALGWRGVGGAEAGTGAAGERRRGSSGAGRGLGREGVGQANSARGGLGVNGRASGQPGHADEPGGRLADTDAQCIGPRGEQPIPVRRQESRAAVGIRGAALAGTGSGLVPLEGRGPEGRDGARPAGEVLADAGRAGDDCGASVAHAELPGRERGGPAHHPNGHHAPGHDADGRDSELADASEPGPSRPERIDVSRSVGDDEGRATPQLRGAPLGTGLFAPGPSSPLWPDILATSPRLAPALSPVTKLLAEGVREGWLLRLAGEMAQGLDVSEETLAGVLRVANGSAARVDEWLRERRPRLQACGNGVVPLQAAVTFTVLADRLRRLM
jgi:hypothetical protein